MIENQSSIENLLDNSKIEDVIHYRAYKYRFVILFNFLFASFANVLVWGIFVPLQTQLMDVFQQELTTVSFCTVVISNIAYAPGNFIANYVIDKFGFRIGVIIGTSFTALGMGIDLLCKYNFYWILVGQSLAGVGQGFFYGTCQKVSAIWFPIKERTLATSTMVALLPFGSAVGTLLPQFFVDPSARGTAAINQIENLLWVQLGIGLASFTFTVVFFREKPPTPPSKSAAKKKTNLRESFLTILKNRNFLLILFTTSMFAGGIVGISSIYQPIVKPYGMGQNELADYLSISVFVGLACNYIGGFIVTKTGKYKMPLFIFSMIQNGILFWMIWILPGRNETYIGLLLMFYNAIVGTITPPTMEYIIEISFPVAEEVPGGLYPLFYQIFGTAVTFICDAIMKNKTPEESSIALYFTLGLSIATTFLFLLGKEDLKRRKYEEIDSIDSKKVSDDAKNY